MLDNNTRIVASFSTIKSMVDAKEYKSPYMILAEFIQYAIADKKLHTFTSLDIKKSLMELFGFELPEAVIRTSIKKIKFVIREKGIYITDKINIKIDDDFNKIKNNSEDKFIEVFELLKSYIEERNLDNKINNEQLTREFISFLIDDNINDGKYVDLISEFVLKYENNLEVQRTLTAIREGSIIYIGLNYNINDIGNMKKTLTLYLATEVLFSLHGLNGEIHKQLAQDLYSQVRDINIKNKKIKLRFFLDVKEEIEDFFYTAKRIVDGKMKLNIDNVAMKNIVNGCSVASDVDIKKADFFLELKNKYGILEDENKNYYIEDDYQYNLEEMGDELQENNVKLISNINKLRQGKIFANNLEAEYLIVTNSMDILKASKEQADILKIDNRCDFAISVEKMTNILWYQIGKLFGKNEFPKNVNAVLKARTLLSSNIAQNVCKLYSETNKKYVSGEIGEEQLKARIIAINKKPLLPEDLDAENIEDIMDFSSESIMKYEEEIAKDKEKIEQYEKELNRIKEDNKSKENKKKEVELELELYKDKERKNNEKKSFRKKCILYVSKIICVVMLGIIIICCCSRFFKQDIINTVAVIATIIGIVPLCFNMFKKDFQKSFGSKNGKE
jgi:hypothetical protein